MIRELIRAAESNVASCASCKGTGVVSESFECFPVIAPDYFIRLYAHALVIRRERCTRCRHLRGIILLAREMVP